jgi:serine/threonine-protein kinase RsbT
VVEVTVTTSILGVLKDYVGTIVARSIIEGANARSGIDPEHVAASQVQTYLDALEVGVLAFVAEPTRERECMSRIRSVLESLCGTHMESTDATRLQVDINEEYDIVTARNHTRTICDQIGFGVAEQIKIATVVSELARNIVLYVGKGRIEIETVDGLRRGIEIRAIDRGAGITNLDAVLNGGYRSKTGMGVGLLGTKRLMDDFEIDTAPGRGTRITVRKFVT